MGDGGCRLPNANPDLLDVNLGASVFELLLEVSGFSLRNSFLDSLRSAFDEVLGFLEARLRPLKERV